MAEKRLIDANELLNILEEYATGIYYSDIFSFTVLKRIVEERKTVDAVEVVRCKDCKLYMTINCTCDGCCISDGWYCADGKRKEVPEDV